MFGFADVAPEFILLEAGAQVGILDSAKI